MSADAFKQAASEDGARVCGQTLAGYQAVKPSKDDCGHPIMPRSQVWWNYERNPQACTSKFLSNMQIAAARNAWSSTFNASVAGCIIG